MNYPISPSSHTPSLWTPILEEDVQIIKKNVSYPFSSSPSLFLSSYPLLLSSPPPSAFLPSSLFPHPSSSFLLPPPWFLFPSSLLPSFPLPSSSISSFFFPSFSLSSSFLLIPLKLRIVSIQRERMGQATNKT